VNGKSLPTITGGLTGVVIQGVSSAKLQDNLKSYGPDVLKSIKLQEAALKVLNENATLPGQVAARAAVTDAFQNAAKSLPSDWAANRRAAILYAAPANPIQSALSAATQLSASFEGLLQGKPGALGELQRAVQYSEAVLRVFGA